MKLSQLQSTLVLAMVVSQASAVDYYKTEFPGNAPITARWAFEPWVWEDNGNTQASTRRVGQRILVARNSDGGRDYR